MCVRVYVCTEGERETPEDLSCILFRPFALAVFLWILLTSIPFCQLGMGLCPISPFPFFSFQTPRYQGDMVTRSWQGLEPVGVELRTDTHHLNRCFQCQLLEEFPSNEWQCRKPPEQNKKLSICPQRLTHTLIS